MPASPSPRWSRSWGPHRARWWWCGDGAVRLCRWRCTPPAPHRTAPSWPQRRPRSCDEGAQPWLQSAPRRGRRAAVPRCAVSARPVSWRAGLRPWARSASGSSRSPRSQTRASTVRTTPGTSSTTCPSNTPSVASYSASVGSAPRPAGEHAPSTAATWPPSTTSPCTSWPTPCTPRCGSSRHSPTGCTTKGGSTRRIAVAPGRPVRAHRCAAPRPGCTCRRRPSPTDPRKASIWWRVHGRPARPSRPGRVPACPPRSEPPSGPPPTRTWRRGSVRTRRRRCVELLQ